MLWCRRISAIGTPASPCFRISTIWLSVNRDFRMGISLAPESLRSKCLPEGEAYGRRWWEKLAEGCLSLLHYFRSSQQVPRLRNSETVLPREGLPGLAVPNAAPV